MGVIRVIMAIVTFVLIFISSIICLPMVVLSKFLSTENKVIGRSL